MTEAARDPLAVIAAMKTAADADAAAVLIRSPSGDTIGRLVPVTARLAADAAVVGDLFRWRKAAMTSFLTVFEPTLDKTQGYLDKLVLVDPARILFLIVDAAGRRVGNIGLCNVTSAEAEVDNVIRGEDAPPSFMPAAQQALIGFAFDRLGAQTVYLRVLSDNDRARSSYRKLGYRETAAQPLRREDTTDGYRLVPDDTGGSGLDLIRMEIVRPN